MDKDAASAGVARELFEQAVGAGEGQMADFAGGFLAAAGAAEFVVAPESAVDQDNVRVDDLLVPFGIVAGEGRGDDYVLFLCSKVKPMLDSSGGRVRVRSWLT